MADSTRRSKREAAGTSAAITKALYDGSSLHALPEAGPSKKRKLAQADEDEADFAPEEEKERSGASKTARSAGKTRGKVPAPRGTSTRGRGSRGRGRGRGGSTATPQAQEDPSDNEEDGMTIDDEDQDVEEDDPPAASTSATSQPKSKYKGKGKANQQGNKKKQSTDAKARADRTPRRGDDKSVKGNCLSKHCAQPLQGRWPLLGSYHARCLMLEPASQHISSLRGMLKKDEVLPFLKDVINDFSSRFGEMTDWFPQKEVAARVKEHAQQINKPAKWDGEDLRPASEGIFKFSNQLAALLEKCPQAWEKWPVAVKSQVAKRGEVLVALLKRLNPLFENLKMNDELYQHSLFGVCALIVWRTGIDLEQTMEEQASASLVPFCEARWVVQEFNSLIRRAMDTANSASTKFLHDIYAVNAPSSTAQFSVHAFMKLFDKIVKELGGQDTGDTQRVVADSLCAFVKNAHVVSATHTYVAPNASRAKQAKKSKKADADEEEDEEEVTMAPDQDEVLEDPPAELPMNALEREVAALEAASKPSGVGMLQVSAGQQAGDTPVAGPSSLPALPGTPTSNRVFNLFPIRTPQKKSISEVPGDNAKPFTVYIAWIDDLSLQKKADISQHLRTRGGDLETDFLISATYCAYEELTSPQVLAAIEHQAILVHKDTFLSWYGGTQALLPMTSDIQDSAAAKYKDLTGFAIQKLLARRERKPRWYEGRLFSTDGSIPRELLQVLYLLGASRLPVTFTSTNNNIVTICAEDAKMDKPYARSISLQDFVKGLYRFSTSAWD